MEIVKEKFEFAGARGHGRNSQLIADFLEVPQGTTVKFVKGEDFDTEPKKFSLSLRTTLWSKGLRVKINVRGDDVFAAVAGPRVEQVAVKEG